MDFVSIRAAFLTYFNKNKHKIVPSAPIVNKDDPELHFINAGMNPFKDYFLGNKTALEKRVANLQKCLRVSGKHNDLEEVGVDTYHHTFFEMMGNWSFGAYFKEEAIALAWELLTTVYHIPKERLWVTVFGGDKADQLEEDKEALGLWKQHVPENRILKASKKDNFWEMGATGPCGPCSEIHVDLRSEQEILELSGDQLVNEDHPQVIEIWNLVFIQYNRMADGSLVALPEKHIDTGMGFERLVRVIQGKSSNYDTDIFEPLFNEISKNSGKTYGESDNEQVDIAFRVIADHIRAITFTIADGQLPSNMGAGYVIRRILRRAVRYGHSFLGLNEAFLYKLIPVLSKQFETIYPEIKAQEALLCNVVKEEELSFLRTLTAGLQRLDKIIDAAPKRLEGKIVFELYDTFGFPVDLTALIATEKGIEIDYEGFEVEMKQQKLRSKRADAHSLEDWVEVRPNQMSQFIGYDQLEVESTIIKYRKLTEKGKEKYQIVLDQTPFYAESGGQVGDTGLLTQGELKVLIIDTQKENDLVIHVANSFPFDSELPVQCEVNRGRRAKIMANHTATHLLHAALRQVLGDHVQQKGSLVHPDYLRFDFSHFAKVTPDELREIEIIINKKIQNNIVLTEHRNMPISQAKELGAMALFGEKYGEQVRVIQFDPNFSTELCGGTHVQATGQIGLLKIVSESAVAAGVRRIEAVSGITAFQQFQQFQQEQEQLAEQLMHPKDLNKALEKVLLESKELKKKLEKLQEGQGQALKESLLSQQVTYGALQLIIAKVTLPSAAILKKLAFELRQQIPNLFMVLAADIESKPQIAVMIGEQVPADQFHAGQLVKNWAKFIKGGGGGQPFFATAGGKEVNGLEEVVKQAKEFIQNLELV